MTRHTPLSRLALGSLITVVVAAMIVVASSHASKSGVDLPLSLPATGEAGGSVVSSEPALPENAQNLQAALLPATDPGPVDTALVRDTKPASNAAGTGTTGATALPYSDDSPAASPDPEPQQKKSAPKKQDSAAKAAGKQKAEAAKKEEAEEARPLRQLSRQFARRRAARAEDANSDADPAHEVVEIPAEEVVEPMIAMSKEHRDMCLVFVGDQMPTAPLANIDGQKQALVDVLGTKLTVVVLWNAGNPYALDQFSRIKRELVPWADKGVRVVAVHVGAVPDNYDELCQTQGDGVVCMLDADEAFFRQVATAKLPRTYLLDAQGKIIWLDMEYSRSTRHDLLNALQFSLQQ